MASRFTHGFHRYFEAARTGFDTLAARMAARAPARRVREARQHADDLHERHRRAMAVILDRCRHRMERATGGLHALSPLAVLARGYSVVRKHGGATVRNASQLDAGEEIGITFHAGTASARVTALRTDSQT
jgi:exodeoxyribonuclease VII large subunit